jgi:hypothetical protein
MVYCSDDVSDVSLQIAINKANPGQTDADGNYIFEVEASNENLDLQNQYVQQNALLGSQEYFLTNGVISDDHQHKTRDENGNVETHKDKIIGEPIKVWTDGRKTFVKGKLYGNNKYAKEYINLLKANSSRVHASVGGIMPKIRRNADGTETVTSFMWNDLALTCSPVNWTVGSAKFSIKSMTNVDFVKALSGGSGTDSAVYSGGRALQAEEKEEGITDILDVPAVEKSDEDEMIIQAAINEMASGGADSEEKLVELLQMNGFSESKARAAAREIIDEGEKKMAKGFFNSISTILNKSNDCKKSSVEKKNPDESSDDGKDILLFDEEDDADEVDEEDEDVKKKGVKDEDEEDDEDEDVKKSYNFDLGSSDSDGEWVDASDVIKSLRDEIESQKDIIRSQGEELEELRKSVTECASAIAQIGATPEARATVMQKSVGAAAVPGRISQGDFDLFKSSLEKSFRESGKTIADIQKSQRLNSAFQRKMAGGTISKSEWNEICEIVHKYGK